MKSYQAFQDAPGAPQNVSETAKSNLNSCGYRVFGELGSPWEAFWTPLGSLGGILDSPNIAPRIRWDPYEKQVNIGQRARRSQEVGGFLKAWSAKCFM